MKQVSWLMMQGPRGPESRNAAAHYGDFARRLLRLAVGHYLLFLAVAGRRVGIELGAVRAELHDLTVGTR